MQTPGGSDQRRWEEIEQLLDEVLELQPAQREAFLDAACAHDHDLRDRVAALLRADEQAGEFLDKPALEQAAPLVSEFHQDPLAGRLVGAYRIVREIGRGGMGVVYLAERADGQFQQQVALKLIKRGMDSDAVMQRFLHERQILARLQHRNIAHLLDGGLTEEGQPYFAMEHVSGKPLTTYCDQLRLDVDARLSLFLKACAAVQYAHQSLVVHRDLKPGNMLVTESGELKLLDFGIARLLGGEAGDSPTTELGSRAMTPEYASPEQLRGEPVTTAADVYALGVVLYELLSGRRPHDMQRGDPHAMARQAATEPVRPSTAVVQGASTAPGSRSVAPDEMCRDRGTRPDRLRRRLAGDLDTICLKALQRDPGRRYASVQGLQDDVERHLLGLPVLARPDTLAYRVSRFVRRHRIGVAAASAAVVGLIGFTTVTAVQSARIRAQATRIDEERRKAEEVKDFVLSLFQVSNPLVESRGDTVTARELLDRGVERIDKELAGQPEVQAELLMVIGHVYEEQGRYDRAAALMERSLTLRRATLGSEHVDVARSMSDLATVLRVKGDYAAAEPLHREALAIQRRLLGAEHPEVADSLSDLGVLFRQNGDLDTAEGFYREALAMRRKVLGPEHEDVLTSMNNLAVLLHQKADYAEAESLHRETLALRRKVLGQEHLHVALSLTNLGWMFSDKGDYGAAEPFYRESIAMRRKLLREDHPLLAQDLNSLGIVLVRKGDLDAAEPLLWEALAMRRKLLGENHVDVAGSLRSLGELRHRQGDLTEAERLTREALTMNRQLVRKGHPRIAVALVGLGRILLDQARRGDAEPLLREALEIRRAAFGPAHPLTREVEGILGEDSLPAAR